MRPPVGRVDACPGRKRPGRGETDQTECALFSLMSCGLEGFLFQDLMMVDLALIPDTCLQRVDGCIRAALAQQGFRALTGTDVKATMKTKLDLEIPGYRILGTSKPKLGWQAMGNPAPHAVAGELRVFPAKAVAVV